MLQVFVFYYSILVSVIMGRETTTRSGAAVA